MPVSETVADTPHYVLMNRNRRIGPEVLQPDSEAVCLPIYGFSAKGAYDKFCMNSQLALTPYPLVKVYLRNQTDAAGNGLKLVAVDAAGPDDPCLHAATMEAVLEARENRRAQVTITYRLILDQEANAYRVEEAFVQVGKE